MRTFYFIIFYFIFTCTLLASQHHIGPNQTYENINDFAWENLSPGDTIFIHYRSFPYKEKWVINAPGTIAQPILIKGIPGAGGELPIIDGNGATTRQELNFWGEERSVLKIGGSSVPDDGTPSYITIENLEIRSAYKDYAFTDDAGNTESYANNAASITIEKGNHITIRSCILTDSGNGLFIAHTSEDIVVESNHIYGNGVSGRYLEHNTYTEANNIIYQYNRFGPLRSGAQGNNLKDRSAGTVIRYNFIQGGNRLMDLVDSEYLNDKTTYSKTYVYGNVLVEDDDGLNNQVIHYGGDSDTPAYFRKGMLYFYHNTLFSLRSGNTTLLRLSTMDEHADVRNNILIVKTNGDKLAMLAESGNLTLKNNLIKPGWTYSHDGSFNGTLDDDGSSFETNSPQFVDSVNLQLHLQSTSPAIGGVGTLHSQAISLHPVTKEYKYHQSYASRQNTDDIGSYEHQSTLPATYRSPLKGEKNNEYINLSWETIQEINISTFCLLHSTDGVSWTTIQSFAPSNTIESKIYQYHHNHPPNGMNFYRLIEENMDGTAKIINTISLDISVDKKIFVYPTLTNGQFFVNIPTQRIDPSQKFLLYNLNGHIVRQFSPSNTYYSLHGLPNGIYYLHVEINGKQSVHRIIKT